MILEKKISIILTTFNSSKFVENTINSILKQSYQNFELIIIDDCSTDNTFLILKKYQSNSSKIRLYKTKENSGTAATPRNLGIKKAKYDIICFIDGDDIWEKEKLFQQIKFTKKYNFIFSSTRYFFCNLKKNFSLYHYIRKYLQVIFFSLIKKNIKFSYIYNPIVFSSVMIKKKLLLKNFFNENKNLVGIEDLDLWVQLFKNESIKPYFISKSLVNNRRRDESLHSNYNLQIVKIIYLQCSNFLKVSKITEVNFLFFSVLIKILRSLIKSMINKLLNHIYKLFFLIIIIFYILYYSPLLKFIGNKYLTITDDFYPSQDIAILYSGKGYDIYYEFGYYFRYLEILSKKKFFNKNNILILFNESRIIESRIIKEILVNNGFDAEKIELVNFDEKLVDLKNILNQPQIQNKRVVVFTSQYETSYFNKVLKKNSVRNEIIFPKQLDYNENNYSFFEKFGYKKLVILNLVKKFLLF